MVATIRHWEEWRTRCAVLRCEEETRTALRGFAWARFGHYARAALGESQIHEQIPAAADCWHLLESDLSVARPRSGRRYKEWLFARLEGSDDAPINIIQGGASLLMRSVVRNWALRETRPYKTLSLDAPMGSDANGRTLADLLPAPEDASVEDQELLRQVATLMPLFFNTIDHKTRLVLLVKQLGIPLYDSDVLALLGVGRSQASNIWRGNFIQLAQLVGEKYSKEPRDWQLRLTLLVAQRLNEKIFSWGRVEKQAQPLFYMAEKGGKVAKIGRCRGWTS